MALSMPQARDRDSLDPVLVRPMNHARKLRNVGRLHLKPA